MRRFAEWIKRNVALVVVLDVVLGLTLFGILQIQQSQINNNATKINCWVATLDAIVTHNPPAIRPIDIAAAQLCERLP